MPISRYRPASQWVGLFFVSILSAIGFLHLRSVWCTASRRIQANHTHEVAFQLAVSFCFHIDALITVPPVVFLHNRCASGRRHAEKQHEKQHEYRNSDAATLAQCEGQQVFPRYLKTIQQTRPFINCRLSCLCVRRAVCKKKFFCPDWGSILSPLGLRRYICTQPVYYGH